MRRLKQSLVILLATATLPSAAFAERSQSYVERSDRTIPAASLRAIDISNARGDVQVRPSPDGQVHVVAIKTSRVHGRTAAQKYAAETKVEAMVEGDRWVMRVTYPKRIEAHISFWDLCSARGQNDSFLPRVDVRLELQVPAAFRSRIETISGDVDLEGLAGSSTVRTTSGDVNLRDVTGAAEISVVSGDVDLLRVKSAAVSGSSGDLSASEVGALRVVTISGDVEIGTARDSVSVRSISGDVRITAALQGVAASSTSGAVTVDGSAGGLKLSSQSGDLKATVARLGRACEMQSTSGELTLELPANVDATLDIHSTSGSIDCRMPVRLVTHDRNSLNGRMGRGGAPIVLRTTSGDITVTSGGN